jgi:YcxB-like protein
LSAWFVLIAAIFLLTVIGARDASSRLSAAAPLTFIAVWFLLDRWGFAYFSARSYARDHAPCIANDQIRILDEEGIAAHCTTSKVSVQWNGIVNVRETPEFFLFFTTPVCAIQLPTRAVDNPEQLRAWLNHMAESGKLANVGTEPTPH